MEDNKNYYQVLEIGIDANQNEIEAAYIRAKNAYSGESIAMYSVLTNEECQNILENIEEAYSILGDPIKREKYDKARGFKRSRTAGGEQNLAFGGMDPTSQTLNHVEQHYQSPHPNRHDDPILHSRYHAMTKSENAGVSKVEAIKKFQLNFERNEEFEQEIENCTEFTGSFLRKIREYKGVTIERLAEMTKVSKTYLRYIEEETYEKLPAPAYLRGFVYQLAKCLKLNSDFVASSYMKRYQLQKLA